MRAGHFLAGALLLALPASASACALHGGMWFDHGFGALPAHVAEDWAPAPPRETPAELSAEARMERQREMMLARYPALRATAASAPAIPQRD